jgi:hypothetical protein
MKTFNHRMVITRAKSTIKLCSISDITLTYDFTKGQSLQEVLEILIRVYVEGNSSQAKRDLIEYLLGVGDS